MKKIKVLHVHTLPVISGSGIHLLLTMAGLDKEKFSTELACAPGGQLADEAAKQGFGFKPIRHFVQPVNIYHDLAALLEMTKLIKKEKYDIVHTHNSKAGFIGRLAAKICGTPVIVHTIHGFAFHEFERPMRQALFVFLEQMAAPWADKLITVSRPLQEWGLRLHIGRQEQYVTIHDGIEIEKFKRDFDILKIKQGLGIRPGELVVGTVAKLWEGKGHACILQAAKSIRAKFPNVRFVFVGEGYLRKDLEKTAQDLGLSDKIIFAGFRTDIPEVTAAFDIAVLASFFEGFGRVLLEAMALAKPVVASAVGGIVEVVDDKMTGLLVPPNDAPALAKALETLLADEGLRRKLGAAGQEKVDVKFSAKTMADRIQAVYLDLLNKKAANR